MNHLLLVRHGESEWNRIGRIQGQTDTPLTELGFEQARRLAEFLAERYDAAQIRVHSSPMRRAVQSAEVIAAAMGFSSADIRVDQRLNDFNLGRISGTRGWEQVALEYPELAYLRLNDPLRFHPPGGESGADFRARLADFLHQPDEPGITHLVVSHGVANKFMRSIRRNLHGADIIALGESQESVYELYGSDETEHKLED